MAIEYSVSQDGMRIDTFPKGVLNIKNTIDYFKEILADTRIQQGAVEVVHFEHVSDFQISYVESEEITQKYQTAKSSQMISATIFVCKTNLAFGIGRMLQTYHAITNPEHRVVVVRSEGELEKVVNSG